MAAATGLAVANNYYAAAAAPADLRRTCTCPGPWPGSSSPSLRSGTRSVSWSCLPLGDLRDRRKLIVLMSVMLAAALGVLAAAPTAGVLLPAAVAVGALSVQAQILVPFAATLASDEERGRVVGTVMSGLLLGILLARTVAGLVAQAGSWRIVYVAAAVAMLAQGATLFATLPTVRVGTALSYPNLLRSVLDIVRQEPLLRLRSAYGAMSFGAFSVLWTSMAFLLAGSPYRYGPATIGLFGLVGAAGAAMASIAGRLADRGRAPTVTIVTALRLGAVLAADPAGSPSHRLADRRDPAARRRCPGAAHHQPERDLQAPTGGSQPDHLRIHDDVLHRRRHRLSVVGGGLGRRRVECCLRRGRHVLRHRRGDLGDCRSTLRSARSWARRDTGTSRIAGRRSQRIEAPEPVRHG